jgi:hypothetical protein
MGGMGETHAEPMILFDDGQAGSCQIFRQLAPVNADLNCDAVPKSGCGKFERAMAPGSTKKRKRRPVSLPDLDQAKPAVLNTLSSADAQRGYRHAIDEFIEWYCFEPKVD